MMRSGLWLRDHHMSVLVDGVEWCWYTMRRSHAMQAARPRYPLFHPDSLRSLEAIANATPPPQPLPCRFESCAQDEGKWRPLGTTVNQMPAVYGAYFRPDADHAHVWVGAAWIEPTRVRAQVVAGTHEPRAFHGDWGGAVPAAQRARLLAAFNAGFRFDEAAGGFFAEGRVGVPLREGAASLIVYQDGRADVGVWGRPLRLTPDVLAVRQNLTLIVKAGRSVAGLDRNANGEWGAGRNQGLYTWRSGLCVTSTGALIYVAGDGLTLVTLAKSLVQAGCERGMELDIHDEWTSFVIYVRNHDSSDGVAGQKLLHAMAFDERRYVVPDDRDFIALFAR